MIHVRHGVWKEYFLNRPEKWEVFFLLWFFFGDGGGILFLVVCCFFFFKSAAQLARCRDKKGLLSISRRKLPKIPGLFKLIFYVLSLH